MRDYCFVKDKDTRVVLLQKTLRDGLYQLQTPPFDCLKPNIKSEILDDFTGFTWIFLLKT